MRIFFVRFGSVVAIAALALSACGSDSDDSTGTGAGSSEPGTTLPQVQSTPFVTAAPSTTQAPTTTTAPLAPGSKIETESTYTIQAGDFPSTVASKFKVDLDELLALNGFELVGQQVPGWPLPGTVIKIPAGATVPGASSTPTSAAGSDDDDATTTTRATTGGSTATSTATTAATPTTVDTCAPSKYEIVAGDTPYGVARKFDTTVAELDAANTGTAGYGGFIVGIEINIPAKSDC